MWHWSHRLSRQSIQGLLTCLLALGMFSTTLAEETEKSRPNILWIIGEDMGPELSCYGTKAVQTPQIDALAKQGIRYTHAFSTAPVCSASRSAFMTGMYQTTIGAHNHRSHRAKDDDFRLPKGVKTIPEIFRDNGYFTCNVTNLVPGTRGTGKTDLNFKHGKLFDGTHWKKRKPGQPFYAQINFSAAHRGGAWTQARKKLKNLVDPKKVDLPPYYPDHPVVRDDWANYLDSIQLLDHQIGTVLGELEKDKLLDNTIVIFFGDHGRCHVRGKQWLYDGGISIPLIVKFPDQRQAGTVSDQFIEAIDISATSLALAGIDVKPLKLQGRVFLGPKVDPPRTEIYAARDRCDETVDRIRCVRTKKFKYIRNYYPDRPYTQTNAYKERQYPALKIMRQLHQEGKLNEVQSAFMAKTRPKVELYDIEADPHETKNLAGLEKYDEIQRQLGEKLDIWIKETDDQGRFAEKKIWLPKPRKKKPMPKKDNG